MEDRPVTLEESVALQDLLIDRNETPKLVAWVQKEDSKKKALDDRLFVLCRFRLLLVQKNFKIDCDGHYYDLQEISGNAEKPGEFTVRFKGFSATLSSPRAQHLIHQLRRNHRFSAPTFPDDAGYSLNVPKELLIPVPRVRFSPLVACTRLYKGWTSYFEVPVSETYVLFVRELIEKKDTCLNLDPMMESLNGNDVKVIFNALRYDQYFSELIITRGAPFAPGLLNELSRALSTNRTLTRLCIEHVLNPKDMLTSLGAVTNLNLSNSLLDEKSFPSFTSLIGRLETGLVSLNLAYCGLNAKSVAGVFKAIASNQATRDSLVSLNVNGNTLGPEGTRELVALLSGDNAIEDLLLAKTSVDTTQLLSTLPNCAMRLRMLDLCSNRLTQQACFMLRPIIQTASALSQLSLRGTEMNADSVKEVISAVSENPFLKLKLDLSENNLGLRGAQVMAPVLKECTTIQALTLVDASLMDDGTAEIVKALTDNSRGVEKLVLSSPARAKGAKGELQSVPALCTLVQSTTPLQSLSLIGNKQSMLKDDLIPVLVALHSNKVVTSLDITGNQVGDRGAVILSEVLKGDGALQSLALDENGFTIRGLKVLAVGLEENRHVTEISPLVDDFKRAQKGSVPGAVQLLERAIRDKLKDNCQPQGDEPTEMTKKLPSPIAVARWINVLRGMRSPKNPNPRVGPLIKACEVLLARSKALYGVRKALQQQGDQTEKAVEGCGAVAKALSGKASASYKEILTACGEASVPVSDLQPGLEPSELKNKLEAALKGAAMNEHVENLTTLRKRFVSVADEFVMTMQQQFIELLADADADLKAIFTQDWLTPADFSSIAIVATEEKKEEREEKKGKKEKKEKEEKKKGKKDKKDKTEKEKPVEEEKTPDTPTIIEKNPALAGILFPGQGPPPRIRKPVVEDEPAPEEPVESPRTPPTKTKGKGKSAKTPKGKKEKSIPKGKREEASSSEPVEPVEEVRFTLKEEKKKPGEISHITARRATPRSRRPPSRRTAAAPPPAQIELSADTPVIGKVKHRKKKSSVSVIPRRPVRPARKAPPVKKVAPGAKVIETVEEDSSDEDLPEPEAPAESASEAESEESEEEKRESEEESEEEEEEEEEEESEEEEEEEDEDEKVSSDEDGDSEEEEEEEEKEDGESSGEEEDEKESASEESDEEDEEDEDESEDEEDAAAKAKAKKADAEKKKKADVDKKKMEAEKKSEAEKKKLEAEKKKQDAVEKKKAEAEKKKAEAEKKKQDAERKKQEAAEKKKAEAEKKKAEAEKKRQETEKKRQEAEKKRQEAEKKRQEEEERLQEEEEARKKQEEEKKVKSANEGVIPAMPELTVAPPKPAKPPKPPKPEVEEMEDVPPPPEEEPPEDAEEAPPPPPPDEEPPEEAEEVPEPAEPVKVKTAVKVKEPAKGPAKGSVKAKSPPKEVKEAVWEPAPILVSEESEEKGGKEIVKGKEPEPEADVVDNRWDSMMKSKESKKEEPTEKVSVKDLIKAKEPAKEVGKEESTEKVSVKNMIKAKESAKDVVKASSEEDPKPKPMGVGRVAAGHVKARSTGAGPGSPATGVGSGSPGSGRARGRSRGPPPAGRAPGGAGGAGGRAAPKKMQLNPGLAALNIPVGAPPAGFMAAKEEEEGGVEEKAEEKPGDIASPGRGRAQPAKAGDSSEGRGRARGRSRGPSAPGRGGSGVGRAALVPAGGVALKSRGAPPVEVKAGSVAPPPLKLKLFEGKDDGKAPSPGSGKSSAGRGSPGGGRAKKPVAKK